jgi:translation initiation factor 2B subunit (eIF-2B alpha/beta/delta family)
MKNDLILKKIEQYIEKIHNDNTSSSVKLAEKSANILKYLTTITDSRDIFRKTAISLLEAQPSMASIFNLVNNLMLRIDKEKNKNIKNLVESYCNNFIQELKVTEQLISKNANELIKNNSLIITHSFSSSILNALFFAKKSGKIFTVICTESRPMNEGIQLAKKLDQKGIKVKLIIDSAVFSFINSADIILVGADAITTNGLVNKIGTKGIVHYAYIYKKPTYALCSTIKLLPDMYKIKLDQQKNQFEILNENISNITTLNYYFDLTSLDFFDGIITEFNSLKTVEIKKRIKNIKIHSCLLKKTK